MNESTPQTPFRRADAPAVALTAVALAAALAAGGCVAPAQSASPNWDSRFGEATRALQAQQLIDPQAPTKHAQRGTESDGRTAREAVERYIESFQRPPQPTVLSIGSVGASGGGGSGGGGTGR